MIFLVSTIGVLMLVIGALGVIWSTLSEHGDAIVAALAGSRQGVAVNAAASRSVRVSIRPAARRPSVAQPLRAAA